MQHKSNIKQSVLLLTVIIMSVVLLACTRFQNTKDVARIGPDGARAAVVKNEALLVCAYDDDACKDVLLEGAILRSEFESKLASLPNRQTIIFYCG